MVRQNNKWFGKNKKYTVPALRQQLYRIWPKTSWSSRAIFSYLGGSISRPTLCTPSSRNSWTSCRKVHTGARKHSPWGRARKASQREYCTPHPRRSCMATAITWNSSTATLTLLQRSTTGTQTLYRCCWYTEYHHLRQNHHTVTHSPARTSWYLHSFRYGIWGWCCCPH